jgi:hypothetical protein
MRRIRLDDEPGPVVHEDPFHGGEVGVALERLADVVDAVVSIPELVVLVRLGRVGRNVPM